MRPGTIVVESDRAHVGARDGGEYLFVIGGTYPSGIGKRQGISATVLGIEEVSGVRYIRYELHGTTRRMTGARIMTLKSFSTNYRGTHIPGAPKEKKPVPRDTAPAPRSLLSDSVAEALTEAVQRLTARVTSLEGRIYTAENLLNIHGIRRV